jgi:hypothetical protein
MIEETPDGGASVTADGSDRGEPATGSSSKGCHLGGEVGMTLTEHTASENAGAIPHPSRDKEVVKVNAYERAMTLNSQLGGGIGADWSFSVMAFSLP